MAGFRPLGGGAGRSRRSAFRPPTRSCWASAAPRSPRIPRPAPTSARPPGQIRVAASATCTPVPPIRTASPGSQRRGACPTWPVTPMGSAAWRWSSPAPTVASHTLKSPPGTSGSAPLWGGLVALADQYAHHDLGFINPAIYSIARSSSYHKAFHDITTDDITHRHQRLPGRPRMGPGDGLGNPQRAGTHPAAGPLHQPQHDIARSSRRLASQRRGRSRSVGSNHKHKHTSGEARRLAPRPPQRPAWTHGSGHREMSDEDKSRASAAHSGGLLHLRGTSHVARRGHASPTGVIRRAPAPSSEPALPSSGASRSRRRLPCSPRDAGAPRWPPRCPSSPEGRSRLCRQC